MENYRGYNIMFFGTYYEAKKYMDDGSVNVLSSKDIWHLYSSIDEQEEELSYQGDGAKEDLKDPTFAALAILICFLIGAYIYYYI